MLFGTVIYVALLMVNAMAVLSEDRFLARIGWTSGPQSAQPGFNQAYDPYAANGQDSIKARMINLIGAVRTLMRVPLIFINAVVIVYELIAG